MNDEILKLARACGIPDADIDSLNEHHPDALEAFYRAAFNAGLEAALSIRPQDIVGGINANALPHEVWTKHVEAIRALKEKP